jgi:hypothetical protein
MTDAVPTEADLRELARICLAQAQATQDKRVAAKLRRMAKEYERRAAQLYGNHPSADKEQ